MASFRCRNVDSLNLFLHVYALVNLFTKNLVLFSLVSLLKSDFEAHIAMILIYLVQTDRTVHKLRFKKSAVGKMTDIVTPIATLTGPPNCTRNIFDSFIDLMKYTHLASTYLISRFLLMIAHTRRFPPISKMTSMESAVVMATPVESGMMEESQ